MAQQTINNGAFDNDPSAESVRASMTKANSNFTELYGQTSAITRVYTVVNDTARNALSGLRVGDIANQTGDNTLWLWGGSSWVRKTGRLLKPANATALAALTGINILDLAQTEDDDVWFVYDGSAWLEIGGAGGGTPASDEIATGATFTKISTAEVAGTATVDVRDAAGTGAYRAATMSHNSTNVNSVIATSLTAGLQSQADLLDIANLDAVGIVARDTSTAQPIFSFAYAGDARGAAGNQRQATIGVFDQNTGHLADRSVSRSGAGVVGMLSRIIRGSNTFIETIGTDAWSIALNDGGVTSTLTATPALLSWSKNLKLTAYPASRSDGTTTKALYVDADGDVLYGTVGASSLNDGGSALASFTGTNVWRVALGGGQTSDLRTTGFELTGVDLRFLTNSRGVELRTATGVRALLTLVDDAGATDSIRLNLTPVV